MASRKEIYTGSRPMVTEPRKDDALWTFDRFEPSMSFGSLDIEIDEDRMAAWSGVFGAEGHRSGLLVVVMMEAFIRLIQPRPNGNVHAAQKLQFISATRSLERHFSVDVRCDGKELRKERRWVNFRADVYQRDALLMTGLITTIWAA